VTARAATRSRSRNSPSEARRSGRKATSNPRIIPFSAPLWRILRWLCIWSLAQLCALLIDTSSPPSNQSFCWTVIKFYVHERDAWTCSICDKPASLYRVRWPEAHHIREYAKNKGRRYVHMPFNIVTLCSTCHQKHHQSKSPLTSGATAE